MKLKDFSSAPPPKPKLNKKISVDEDSSGQAGYMASLIAKILGIMSVICNNIVLKITEEDIVLSMNIQHLSVHSADDRWRRSFTDVSPTNVTTLGDEQGNEEGWLSWAWNMMPSLLSDEQNVFEFGFYVENIYLSLKSHGFLSDPIIMSTKKVVSKSLLAIHAQEIFSVNVFSGVRKFNVKCGEGFTKELKNLEIV